MQAEKDHDILKKNDKYGNFVVFYPISFNNWGAMKESRLTRHGDCFFESYKLGILKSVSCWDNSWPFVICFGFCLLNSQKQIVVGIDWDSLHFLIQPLFFWKIYPDFCRRFEKAMGTWMSEHMLTLINYLPYLVNPTALAFLIFIVSRVVKTPRFKSRSYKINFFRKFNFTKLFSFFLKIHFNIYQKSFWVELN